MKKSSIANEEDNNEESPPTTTTTLIKKSSSSSLNNNNNTSIQSLTSIIDDNEDEKPFLEHDLESSSSTTIPMMNIISSNTSPNINNNNSSSSIQTSTIGGYALTILGTQMLNHIFNSYYVETFLFIHNLPYHYFYIGQFLFAIFNAVNDPLFGYISDELIKHKKKNYSRQRLMLLGAPFLVVSFLLPWIQIRSLFESSGNSSLGDFIAFAQFVCALFFWDTSFTWLVLNHCALLPELTESDREKGKISTAVSVCSVLGSLFLLPTFILFERPNSKSNVNGNNTGDNSYTGNLNYFRIYCTCLAVLSFCVIYFGNFLINRGRRHSSLLSNSSSNIDSTDRTDTDSTVSDVGEVPEAPQSKFTFRHLLYLIRSYLIDFFAIFKQLISLRNFDLFVLVNFLNIFSVALFDSFKVRYIRQYVQPWMVDSFFSSSTGIQDNSSAGGNLASLYLTLTTFSSESFAVLNSYLSIRYPAYSLLRNTFIMRSVISLLCLLALIFIDLSSTSVLPVLFLFCNMIILGSVGRLLEIALSNVVDEDFTTHKRKEKNSGNTFGINALLTKPAYSLAPSVAALFVNNQDSNSGGGSGSGSSSLTLFYLFVVGNLVCAVLQLVFWKFYTLRGQQSATATVSSSAGRDETESLSRSVENCH